MRIAIYHLSIKIVSRGKGKSAVAAAAYRAGEKITNDYDGIIHDYTRKSGVVHTEILLPELAPKEYFERTVLWNAVEEIEKARNSQLAREIEIALPIELSAGQNISLVREYCNKHFVSKGMCADFCIHDTGNGNPHAHIMLTMRPIELDGKWGAKSKKEYILDDNGEIIKLASGEYKSKKVCTVDWNEQTKAEEWRQGWADICNRYLEQNDHTKRIDHRSYERQGIDKIPTIHLGIAASAMEKRGIKTERGNINREIEVTNKDIRQLRARIRKSKEWLYSQPIENAPTFVSIIGNVADSKNLDNRWQKITDLKTRAKVFGFLQSNNITDMTQLVEKVTQMSNEHYKVSEKIKKVDRRLGTLTQHLTQYKIYKQHQDLYKKYKSLDPKKREDFYGKHSDEIQDYDNSKEYLKTVMNGKTAIPIKVWKAEQEKLTVERLLLCEDYYRLKDEVQSVEVLRKGAESIMQEHQIQQSKKIQDIEL